MFTNIGQGNLPKQPPTCNVSDVCDTCKSFVTGLWEIDFEMVYDATELAASATSGTCHLCALLWRTYDLHCKGRPKNVRVERAGHVLMINSNRDAVLTIVRHPGKDLDSTTDYQIGLVQIPGAGSPTHFDIVKHWLKDCDDRHKEPHVQCRNTSRRELPTRLLDVSSLANGVVYLRERNNLPVNGGEWVALSHRWGGGDYCTTRATLDKHLSGIDFADLPDTFKDAVRGTSALGKDYLWIDSLCVIQGEDGDFQEEFKRMEDVYSGAYCVIAASSATDHYSGFLKERKFRDYVGFAPQNQESSAFFICENVDNFKRHVLDGGLNSRGWVLQEHALARRTIFFTDYQTYFECGCGVQCETSTKLWK